MLAGVVDPLFAPFAGADTPGASVAVFHRGSTVLCRAYGLALLEPSTPASVHTNYRLASLTKQFTAAAILKLVEQGKLQLDTPLLELLPELAHEPASVFHLLTHTSGILDYEDLLPADQTIQVQDSDMLVLLSTENRRHFAPGTAFRYSNSGYVLLGLIVERISGCPFAEFLQEHIFQPLGMDSTLAYQAGHSPVPERAFGYSAAGDGFQLTDQSVTSATLGDGGVYASVAELARWEDAFVHARVLSAATLEHAWSPARLRDGTPVPYGYGWYVDVDRGRRRLTHHGETVGFTNATVRYPDEQLSVWVLTNRTGGAPWDLAQTVADRALTLLEGGPRSRSAPAWPFQWAGG